MNIVIFSNAPIKKITEALNLPFSPKEGWVSAAIAMLQTVESVSYTHLDVYKRQMIRLRKTFDGSLIMLEIAS